MRLLFLDFDCERGDKVFDKQQSRVFSLIKLITAVNLENIYERVAKRDCKLKLFYMHKQTKTVRSCNLIFLYTKSCHVLMSF